MKLKALGPPDVHVVLWPGNEYSSRQPTLIVPANKDTPAATSFIRRGEAK